MITANVISSTRIREIESLVEHRIPLAYHKQKREKIILELKQPGQEDPANPFKDWCMRDSKNARACGRLHQT